MRRRLLGIGVGLIVVLVVIGGVAADWFRPEPTLVANLAGEGSSAQNASFRARLGHGFPVGSAEQALAEELRDQGFIRRDWKGATGVRHSATWHRDGFPCITDASVNWIADVRGNLVQVDGLYGYACL